MKMQKSQQKIIIVVSLVLIATLGFTQFVYFPKRRLMNQLKNQINAIKDKIAEAQINFGQPEQLAQAVVLQKRRLALLEVKFPKKQDVPSVIKELSNAASQFGIKIISMKPKDSKPYLDALGQPVLIEELTCEKLPFAIELECSFFEFGKYLEFLFDKLSAQISIDELKINRDELIQPNLKVSVVLSIYVLSGKSS